MEIDDERRMIAQKLRNVPVAADMRMVLQAMGINPTMKPYSAAQLLAFIIDPGQEQSCSIECYPPGYEDNLHYEVCSECGTILAAKKPGDHRAQTANYCPNCGRKVVCDAD